jgi:predicted DCC family thiol-disulfide oxidoreductase YuxK
MLNDESIVNQLGVPMVFFDGVCGLCNRFISILFFIDRAKVFKVGTLQGPYASRSLPKDLTEGLNSIVVVSDTGKIFTKSRAILYVLRRVGGVLAPLAWLGSILPRMLLDLVYDFISKNRYRVFGKFATCRLPNADEKARFLD